MRSSQASSESIGPKLLLGASFGGESSPTERCGLDLVKGASHRTAFGNGADRIRGYRSPPAPPYSQQGKGGGGDNPEALTEGKSTMPGGWDLLQNDVALDLVHGASPRSPCGDRPDTIGKVWVDETRLQI